jgi:hypothetical protein
MRVHRREHDERGEWMGRRIAIGLILLAACSSQTPAQTRRPAVTPQAGSGPVTVPVAPDSGPAAAPISNPLDGGIVPVNPNPCGPMPCPAPDAGAPALPDTDGFSAADGDCDDFSDVVNPGAYDVPNNGIDEDCQGGDALTATCDDALALDSSDPKQAARAIELCATAEESSRRWGVISARWTTPDGKGMPMSPLQHGVLPGFGKSFAPRAGKALLALSSGVARAPGQTAYTEACDDSFPAESTGLPDKFNGSSTTCADFLEDTTVVDAVALELKVRMPTNATAISFDSAFFTSEYPIYICTPFNDYFQVIALPLRAGGSADGNVVFDLDGNAVSVNNSLLRVCEPGEHGGKRFECPLGFDPLVGTGYDSCERDPGGGIGIFGGGGPSQERSGASTGWLNTEFAIQPAEVITLRITAWDSGDSALDSSAIVDHFRFRLREQPPPPEKPMTTPIEPE